MQKNKITIKKIVIYSLICKAFVLPLYGESKNCKTLNQYIISALEQSAELQSAFSVYQAQKQKAPQVSALPDPKISYSHFISSIETRVGPMEHKVGIAQSFPWFGTLSLREEIADIKTKAAHYAFLAKKNSLVSDVVRAFFELSYLDDSYEITKSNLDLLKKMEEVLTQRYRSKSGSQSNLIKIQLELGKLEDKLREIDALKEPLRVEFNSLLNRDLESPVHLVKQNLAIGNKFLSKTESALESILEERNPEIQLLETLDRANKQGITLAKKDYYPKFSVGLDYTFIGEREQAGFESGDDAIAAMVSMTLPFNFSKNSAALKEAKFKSNASHKNLVATTFRLKALLARTLFNVKDSKRKISLYEATLVPKAEEGLEVAFTNFESGSISFLDLLDAERELLSFQLELSRASTDFAIQSSKLRALLGDYNNFEKI